MRYRPAIRRPGRKRPSFNADVDELGGRDFDDEEDGPAADGRGDLGDLALAKSRVAASSEAEVRVASSDPTGFPQLEQKRLVIGTSALHARHRGMNFSAD